MTAASRAPDYAGPEGGPRHQRVSSIDRIDFSGWRLDALPDRAVIPAILSS
jgi:hypothetical protein